MTEKRSKNGGSIIYKCICDCGRECEVPSTELRAGRKTRCENCASSNGENVIETLLKDNQIEYIKEYTFPYERTQSNGILRFDFYIVEKNYVIEFDGEQHFRAVPFFGGEEELQKIKQRDEEKNQLCKKYNIPIIRIPYKQLRKGIVLQDLLLETTNFLVQ